MTAEVCSTCGRCYIEQNPVLCNVFGIENPRLVHTGFVLFDPVAEIDVPDLDSCDWVTCPGKETDGVVTTQNFVKAASGKGLEALAKMYGVPRKHYLWLFKESEASLRRRVLDRLRAPTRADLKREYLEEQFRLFLWRVAVSVMCGLCGFAAIWYWGLQ